LSTERNIRRYLLYRASADALAWLPVFFLFFDERLTLKQVLQLEAIYYITVVVMEVPSGYSSGYFSDRAGRKLTLILSCLSLILAYCFFLLSPTFTGLAVGQCLLAFSMAYRSGTDTAFHYESLQALNREDEYGDREALAGKYGFLATAIAALAGGLLGSVDLSLAYWLSMVTATMALIVAFNFKEPNPTTYTRTTDNKGNTTTFTTQLIDCAKYLDHKKMMWIFIYSIIMFAMVHIPYEFYQPYLSLLETERSIPVSAPTLAGIVFALTAVVAAIASAYSMAWLRKTGLVSLLAHAAIIEIMVIAVMAIWLHPLVATLMILRSGPMALIVAPINAAIAPLIANQHRATFLSMQSLASRLTFALLMLVFSLVTTKDGDATWEVLSWILRLSLLGAIGATVVLFVYAKTHGALND